jgi:hypothetical protein
MVRKKFACQHDRVDEKGAETFATEKIFALSFRFFLVHLHVLAIL